MRLTVSQLSNPKPEAISDIAKLALPVPTAAIAEWLEAASQAWIATFNNKVIALALVNSNGDDYTLDYFCVREATQRRGVGAYLLQQLGAEQGDSQLLDGVSERLEGEVLAAWQGFMEACDWQQSISGQWFRA